MKKTLLIFGVVLVLAVLPRIVFAATLYASPSSESFGLGSAFSVSVTVTSQTHPLQDNWYNRSDATLSWDRPSGAFGYSFELDQSADTVPDSILDTTITTTKSYQGLADGTWYFHIKARAQSASAGFGPTTDYKIQVDTQAPQSVDIKLAGQTDPDNAGRTPAITFLATDATSGIDYYDVYLDGSVIEAKSSSPYTFGKLDTGQHYIRVSAFDMAGNEQQSELTVNVARPAVLGFFGRNLTVPVYILLFMNLLILFLFAFLFWVLFKRKKEKTSPAVYETVSVNKTRKRVDKKTGKLSKKIRNKTIKY